MSSVECTNCNTTLDSSTAKFCLECGTPISVTEDVVVVEQVTPSHGLADDSSSHVAGASNSDAEARVLAEPPVPERVANDGTSNLSPAVVESAQGVVQAQSRSADPGWYPSRDGRLRYFDGTAWTNNFAPNEVTVPAAPAQVMYAVQPPKSIAIAMVLAFFFSGFGLLYATKKWAPITIPVTIGIWFFYVVSLLTVFFFIFMLFVVLAWSGICMYLAYTAASEENAAFAAANQNRQITT